MIGNMLSPPLSGWMAGRYGLREAGDGEDGASGDGEDGDLLGVIGAGVSSEVHGGTAQDIELDLWTLWFIFSYD